MDISQAGYKSLLKDDGFSDLNVLKVRRLVGIALAELLGTAVFVGLGCGNILSSLTGQETSPHLNNVIAFAFGISTSIIIFGPISGALMNPALNVAAMVLGHMSLPKCLFYSLFQLLGGFLGVLTVKLVTPNTPDNFCLTLPGENATTAAVFTVEFLTTGILTLGLCHVLDTRTKEQTSIIFLKFAIIITAIAVPAAKYGGCSMNPARSFGPALLASNWTYHWIYWCATCGGAFLVACLYRTFFHHTIYEEEREEANPI